MKLILIAAVLFSASLHAQIDISKPVPSAPVPGISGISPTDKKDVKLSNNLKWKMNGNRYLTGGLFFVAGMAKGLNETIQYNYNGFKSFFPKANNQWFYPSLSFRNKYKDGDPAKGPKFPLSTSALVMFTDQYHLDNFIQRASMTAAVVIKVGEGKKPLKHYLLDIIYYSLCHQVGFATVYYPMKARNK